MSTRRMIRAAGFAAALGAALPAYASEHVFAKPSVALVRTQSDSSACAADARRGQTISVVPWNMTGGIAGAAAVSVLSSIADGIAQGRAAAAYVERCMRKLGYAKLELSADDTSALSKVHGSEARQAWLEAYLARIDTARVAAALKPKVDRLPSAPAHEQYALHGVRLDSATLHLTAGTVRRGQTILTAEASYRQNAVIAETFNLGAKLNVQADKGAVFHLVDMRADPDGEESSDWCGPLTNATVFGKRVTRPGCIHSAFEGYVWALWLEEMRPLLTTSINPPMLGVQREGKLVLQPIPIGDDRQPVEMRLHNISTAGVEVDLMALGSGKALSLWRQEFSLADGHETIIPFWTKRLSLHRQGDAIRAELLDGGDGTAPNGIAPA